MHVAGGVRRTPYTGLLRQRLSGLLLWMRVAEPVTWCYSCSYRVVERLAKISWLPGTLRMHVFWRRHYDARQFDVVKPHC